MELGDRLASYGRDCSVDDRDQVDVADARYVVARGQRPAHPEVGDPAEPAQPAPESSTAPGDEPTSAASGAVELGAVRVPDRQRAAGDRVARLARSAPQRPVRRRARRRAAGPPRGRRPGGPSC